MNRWGYSVADWRTLNAALLNPHRLKVRATLLDLDGKHLNDLTDKLADGQINVDGTSSDGIARTATIVLRDPRRALPFDSSSPADSALWYDRMVRIVYEVRSGDGWLGGPAFVGPVTSLVRDGQTVSVGCKDKAWLASGNAWTVLHLGKGMKVTDAITRVMRDLTGETLLDIPDLPQRLPHHVTITPDDIPWHEARKLANAVDRQLYYDSGGWCRLRRWPGRSLFTFTDRHMVTNPKLTAPTSFANAVRVIGAVPKGSKTHVHASGVASGPLGPARLTRNGVGLHLMATGATIRDDKIKTQAAAQARVDRELADGTRAPIVVTFDALPGPGAFLDPGDLVRAHTDDGGETFRYMQASVPLNVSAGTPMAVGFLDRRMAHHNPRPPRHHAHRHHKSRKHR